jgi:prepilin peptidase CpaA
MNLLASAPAWLIASLFVLVLLAAIEDGWRMKISNLISAAVVLGAFAALLLNGPVVGFWQNLALFAAVLVVGTMMFARGWMGGGDIKLLAASALWFDLSSGWKLMVAIAIAGGLEALIVIGLRRLPWPNSVRQRVLLLRPREGIPYGIAIAFGVALMAWWSRS